MSEFAKDKDVPNKNANDLISRQAAIDAIDGVDWYHINKDGQLTPGANGKEDEPLYKAKDVYDVLNTMPSAQQWIPCSERLPKYGKSVLTQLDYGYMEVNWIIDDEEGEWFSDGAVAWMPLPEPYKEGADDKKG